MKEETKKLLENIKANPSSGISYDAKMSLVQVEQIFAIDELTTEVKDLKTKLTNYSNAARKEGERMFILTIALGFVALLQLLTAFQQTNLTKEQGISERIYQARKVQNAIEFCNQNKDAKESGLFEVSTGKSAPCREVLQIYGNNNSIWSKIKNLFTY